MIWDTYREGRSFAFLTLYQQLTVLHFYHVLTDGQPETCTTIFPRDRSIGLLERLEDGPQPFLSDADTPVADGGLCPYPLFIPLSNTCYNSYMSFVSKFQCIAQQVIQHLAQPVWVSFHYHIGRDDALEDTSARFFF